MLHRKLIEPVLAQLEGERASYFGQVLQRLDEDKRVEVAPNLVFLVLKEIMPLCPTYLPVRELVDRLMEFVAVNQARLNRAIFDPEFVESNKHRSAFGEIGGEFINQILTATFMRLESGKISERQQAVYRFSADDDPDDFPYQDEDDNG